MLSPFLRAIAVICALPAALCAAELAVDTETLYRARDWFSLRAIPAASLNSAQRAALAAAFLQADAETLLRQLIRENPSSSDALDAYQALTQLFIQTAQYRKLEENLADQQNAFPDNPRGARAREAMSGFRGLPDQTTVDNQGGSVRHDGGLFVPITINGKSANYFIDTGAAISSCSESEAKRLGLRFVGQGALSTSTTQQAAFRAAIADEFAVGGLRLKQVAFAVFPDANEPWVNLAEGRRGLIGWPVIVAARGLEWSQDGTARFGEPDRRKADEKPNICILNSRPAVQLSIAGRYAIFALDSGAVNTDIYARFGAVFPELTSAGKHTATEVRGIGGTEIYEAVELPELQFSLPRAITHLKGAKMIIKQVGPEPFVGNLGFDILKQAGRFVIDVPRMRLELFPPAP